MESIIYLIPIALALGILALAGFLWALKSGQFDDPEGAANRILWDNEENSEKTREPQIRNPDSGPS